MLRRTGSCFWKDHSQLSSHCGLPNIQASSHLCILFPGLPWALGPEPQPRTRTCPAPFWALSLNAPFMGLLALARCLTVPPCYTPIRVSCPQLRSFSSTDCLPGEDPLPLTQPTSEQCLSLPERLPYPLHPSLYQAQSSPSKLPGSPLV